VIGGSVVDRTDLPEVLCIPSPATPERDRPCPGHPTLNYVALRR
jgi:hypothetical protein